MTSRTSDGAGQDEPVTPRPRRARNIIIQILFAVVGLQTVYTTLHSSSDPVKDWPPELAANHSGYCRIDNYTACHENDWFGILRSQLPQGNMAILKETCLEWKDKPDPAKARVIDALGDDVLYLCRMKAPSAIPPQKAKR